MKYINVQDACDIIMYFITFLSFSREFFLLFGAESSVLLASVILLLFDLLNTNLFSLFHVNRFDKYFLVLELVTLGGQVELVVPTIAGGSYWVRSIFLAALYFLSRRLRTLCLLIHRTF